MVRTVVGAAAMVWVGFAGSMAIMPPASADGWRVRDSAVPYYRPPPPPGGYYSPYGPRYDYGYGYGPSVDGLAAYTWLDLSDAQRRELEEIYDAYARRSEQRTAHMLRLEARIHRLYADRRADARLLREAHRALRELRHEQAYDATQTHHWMREVLTESQRERFYERWGSYYGWP